MNTLKVIATLTLLTSLGCSNSSNSGSSGGDFNGGFSTTPTSGEYVAENELPSTDTSRYTVGCATPGQSAEKAQVDSRLKPGMVFVSSLKGKSQKGQYSLTLSDSLQSVTAKSIVSNTSVISTSGIQGLNPGFSATKTCTLSNDGQFPCVFNPMPQVGPFPQSNCMFSNTVMVDSKYHIGTYKINGKLVKAYRQSYSMKGDLSCDGLSLGKATDETISIFSNDVPANGTASFCGGVYLFSANIIKLENGKVVIGYVSEINSF